MSSMSRRTLLQSITAAGTAVAVPGLLTGCSSGSEGGDVSNSGKKLAPWPAYKAVAGAKPDLAPTDEGVQPGYTSYPSDLSRSVSRKPGDGSTIRVMSLTFGTPPKGRGENRYWKAVEEALGVKIEFTIVPQSDYQKKMATVLADDPEALPDIINLFHGFVLPREPEFVQRRAQDLSEFLSGDAAADYPNLANIPTHAWRDMGRIGGRIYGVPLERPVPGSTLWVNEGTFTDAGMKEGWSAEDFTTVAEKATRGKKFALGAAAGSGYGNAVHAAAHNAPSEWSVDKSGTFHSAYGDERFRAAVAFQAKLRKSGLYHPEGASMSTPDLDTLFLNGTVASLQNGFGSYQQVFPDSRGLFTPAASLPYSVNGTPGGLVSSRRSFGQTILKKAKKERIQLLLRVLDYLAAPFGTKEWELLHYGVEGTHFKRGKDGSPEVTKLGEVENITNLPFKYLAEGPQVLFVPGMPDVVRDLHAWQQKVVPVSIRKPSYGLRSNTASTKGATLKSLMTDTITSVVAGRAPLSEYDAAVKKWRSRGGDKMTEEFTKEYAANS
ncbi:extracellular solute-binding protein [Streptomyces sp. N2-109]|uniref:Extracellular solute-binding protein n=1 Tax=Streptomyces gossypii TaxID=2883101 RepID=A0ABT2JUK4_9ACTN|nr:extracellular solute-binding protein [Streptomyces gossypii]MCT2591562.1 extracellular solute-binding protein [Streptomyces gossypii]